LCWTSDDGAYASSRRSVSELKGDILGVQTQLDSMEQQLRETKIEVRLGAQEEKVFASACA
jgi:hypothetical protein